MRFFALVIWTAIAAQSFLQINAVFADEEAAIRRLQELGGTIQFDREGKDRAVIRVYLSGVKISDEDLLILKELHELKELSISGQTQKSPPRSDGKITDKGVKTIGQLSKLESLNLCGNRITDTGLKELRELKEIRRLDLSLTAVTDDGLRALRPFEKLEYLRVWDLKISDVGLNHLQEIKSLKQVLLAHAEVTESGLEKLRNALPHTKVQSISYGR
jgi:repressor of nif and glnA expression